jgi:hypothetical protein
MNQFNYELDERNLRLQLKDLEVPVREDAWQKFEAFSGIQPRMRMKRQFNFQVVMNRNVILPVIFGGIIILFSFLLFNFISIKDHKADNNKPEANQKAELSAASVMPVSETKTEVKADLNSQPLSQPVNEPTQIASIPPAAAEPQAQKAEVPAGPASIDQGTKPATEVAPSSLDNLMNSTTTTEPAKKPRRKVKADAMQDIRPTVVSDDAEAEIHPN